MKNLILIAFLSVGFLFTSCDNDVVQEEETIDVSLAAMEAAVLGGNPGSNGNLNALVFGPQQSGALLRSLHQALRLTSDQSDTMRRLTAEMKQSLMETRMALHLGEIDRREALEQIKTARRNFVASVHSTLNREQKERFARWLRTNWDK